MNKQHTITAVLDLHVLVSIYTWITSKSTVVYLHSTRCLIGTPAEDRWILHNLRHHVHRGLDSQNLSIYETIYGY